jgi:hypothetical protein
MRLSLSIPLQIPKAQLAVFEFPSEFTAPNTAAPPDAAAFADDFAFPPEFAAPKTAAVSAVEGFVAAFSNT